MHTLHSPRDAAHWLQQRVTGSLTCDSRKAKPGDGFIAWPGAVVDGRKFVPDAHRQGAVACLVEEKGSTDFRLDEATTAGYSGLKSAAGAIAAEYFGLPSRELALVAVTGTNGKTSTAWWLAQALSSLPGAMAMPCGVIGTLGVGLPGQVRATGLTTPDPVLLQQTLRAFVRDGLRACAIEASSIGLQERRLDGMEARVAIFTNLTQDHLDYHGSMEAYWLAKRTLFTWPGLVAAVVNVDDAHGEKLAQELAAIALDLWTTSCQRAARLQACNIAYDRQGLAFDVVEQGGAIARLQSRVIGSYNVSNLLGVLAAMRALGVPLDAAVVACSALQPVPGRMECFGDVGQPLVAVDYAHTPDALSQALTALQPLAQARGGKLWCVFGCGGDRDTSKRPMMGAIATQKADRVVVTSDNPRSERPEAIIAQILLGMSRSPCVSVEPDRAQAILHAITNAASNDVVLLAGKGHEETQEVAGEKRPFSDRLHARQALASRSAITPGVPA